MKDKQFLSCNSLPTHSHPQSSTIIFITSQGAVLNFVLPSLECAMRKKWYGSMHQDLLPVSFNIFTLFSHCLHFTAGVVL